MTATSRSKSLRPACALALGIDIGERPEQQLDHGLLRWVGGRRRHHPARVVRKQRSDAAFLPPVEVEPQPPLSAGFFRDLVPQQQERVLDQRQLVLAAARIGDEALGQIGVNRAAIKLSRTADGAQQSFPVHARQ